MISDPSGIRILAEDLFQDLRAVEGRPPDAALDLWEAELQPKASLLAEANRADVHRTWMNAEAARKQAEFELEAAQGRCLDKLPPAPSTFSVRSASLAACVALAGEIALTAQSIPSLLNIEVMSVLGFFLCGLPLAVTAALKACVEEILPWLDTWLKKAALWLPFAILNSALALELGVRRDGALALLRALLEGKPVLPDVELGKLVPLLCVAAVFDAAVLGAKALYGFDLQRAVARKQELERDVDLKHAALQNAKAVEESAKNEHETVEVRLAAIREAVVLRGQSAVAEIRARVRPVETMVTEAFAGGENLHRPDSTMVH